MAKSKSMYSLKGVFTKLLEDTEKSAFIIPAYQRGFKWTSMGPNSQVVVLMNDLLEAYNQNADRYYLQFITIKTYNEYLEVIDGQQRLTTLSIIFSILHSFPELKDEENFVLEKLNYQIRDNFIKKHIYEDINLITGYKSWQQYITQFPENDNQDVFYIFHAAKVIFQYVEKIKRREFYNYISNNVLLIINLIDDNLNSEKLFINVNKGKKLNDEDLVKGLLITKIPLDYQAIQYRLTENEINEVRTNIGRQWDDLTHWVTKKEIKKFYLIQDDEDNRLSWLFNLSYPDAKINTTNPIFNYLDNKYRKKELTAPDIFNTIYDTMLILNDWYFDPVQHNLLGYILHSKQSPGIMELARKLMKFKDKSEILKELKSLSKNLLPIDDAGKLKSELNYFDFKDELFNLFLFIDISKFLPIKGRKAVPYNLSLISEENWSLEHIFPQNEKDLKSLDFLGENDLKIIKELLPADISEISISNEEDRMSIAELYKKLMTSNQCKIENEEKKYLAFLLEKEASDLHKIGNLALLQQNINSSLSNNFFNSKRKKIVEKVSNGEFVPFHTYDVFSKLIIMNDTSLNLWTKEDISGHEKYISDQISDIVVYLNTNN